MRRTAPPPDFRYVGLEPGPDDRMTRAKAGGVGLATFGAGIAVSNGSTDLPVLAASAGLGCVSAWLVARRFRFGNHHRAARRVSMAIVPWGIVLRSLDGLRLLRWPAVRRVDVSFVHEMDHATPSIVWSIVTVTTDREMYCGRTSGTAPLDRLEAHLDRYAEEATSPVALDLDGEVPVPELSLEPTFERLLAVARRVLNTGTASERLSLPPASYRQHGGVGARDETVASLAEILRGTIDTPADPRPLAAILGVELGARALRSGVTRLATSPHPLVAAVSRAAALRLGGSVKNVGAVEEVADFLPVEDVTRIQSWCAASA